MSIAHLKKQAKNLVRLLPAHISANPTGGSLAACQELIARASGYPSFHAATATESIERLDALPLSRRIFDDLQDVHRQAAADPDNMWPWRTEGLIRAVLELQLFLEARGETLSDETLYEFHALEDACQKWQSLLPRGASTLEHYLSILPAYESPEKRGNKPVEETTVIHHGFNSMAIKSLHKEQKPLIQHKPLDVVNHGDGHFTAYVDPTIAEEHLRASLERLCVTATSLEFNGDHPALNRICPDLARRGVSIAPYRTPLAMASLHVPVHMVDKLFPRQGLVLISSRDGNGKTSFRAGLADALLDLPDTRRVISFENPIEYTYKKIPRTGSIFQVLSGNTTTQSFRTSLVQAMRRRPDVIMAGEVRDSECIETVAQVAMTGHAMYAEVLADSAVDAVMQLLKRIPSQKVDRLGQDLIHSLSLVAWQTLVTGSNGKCIAIYEFLSFSNKTKDDLLALDLNNHDAIRQMLNAEIQRQGNDLVSNAKEALRQGRIRQNTFDYLKAMRTNETVDTAA